MSGRSAYVRKKITEQKTGRLNSVPALRPFDNDDKSVVNEYPFPQGTGHGTTNARFLKFPELAGNTNLPNCPAENTSFSNNSSGSQSGGSEIGKREPGTPQSTGPMPDYAYARARKPILKTEDVSGIERSGFRAAVDKRSEEFRKGLTKAFTFGTKKKRGIDLTIRPLSVATIRPLDELENDKVADSLGFSLQSPQNLTWDPEYQQMISPPPSNRLPPLPPSYVSSPIKRWVGSNKPVQRWNKLRKDPELWDPNGDVLVYLGSKDQPQRPKPSFRLSSHIIEATESRFLIKTMRQGSREEDFEESMSMPPSPEGYPSILRAFTCPQHIGNNTGRSVGQLTPPVSEDASLMDAYAQKSYEMYLPPPPGLTNTEAHRHAITTRNIFAVLHHASLVGLSLFQTLSDLLARLEAYIPTGVDNVSTILNYLSARGIDDARNDPETAVSVLAWSETPEVRWWEGWREAFLHCAGMYPRLEGCADYKYITPITRALLERAFLETQLRVQAAEERLSGFTYHDIWPSTGSLAHNAARAAADHLQQFFVSHYANTYGSWPPPIRTRGSSGGEELWLSRKVTKKLQLDFGALYDYLVNRDIVWDESETRSSRKWMMVSESGNKSFSADTENLPLTDLLIEFDNRMRFPHIPHPYPLVPVSIPAPNVSGSNREKSRKEKQMKQSDTDRTLERRVQLAYTEATNIYSFGSDFAHSELTDNFVKFEKADKVGFVDPLCARRGRWVLIYGILQTLASISVDSPDVRHKDGVSYHLSPRLKGTRIPPWKGAPICSNEACHELSHCWTTPRTWYKRTESVESDNSLTSGAAADRLQRTMRPRKTHNLSRPPTSSSGFTGWHTSGTLGIRTSGIVMPPSPTTIWGGSSALSDTALSDENTSARTLPFPPKPHNVLAQEDNNNNNAEDKHNGFIRGVPYRMTWGDAKTGRSHVTSVKGTGRVNEVVKWPARLHSIRQLNTPMPSVVIPAMTGANDFLDTNHTLPSLVSEVNRSDGATLSSSGSSDELGPVIKDFDDLDSVAEEYAGR